MSGRTLYLSDLDGTLLTSAQTLSPFTVWALNALIDRGLCFSYATARSIATAGPITAALASSVPAIVYNGTFILENGTHRRLLSHFFEPQDGKEILSTLLAGGVCPITYAYIDGRERFSYDPEAISGAARRFVDTRSDARKRLAPTGALGDGELFHFSCIDTAEKLQPLYEHLRERFSAVYYREAYTGEMWLELHPPGVTKACAALALKAMLGCDRLVCFGDGKNDIPLFEAADEAYAVENADPALRRLATGIIGANDEDGVARFLAERIRI